MEVWKDVVGYEGLYQVSSQGRVKSLDRKDCRGNRIKGKIIKPLPINSGYLMVHLRNREGERKGKLVHRIVAEAFLIALKNETQVDHIDENKVNNRVDNLRWVTPKVNTNHGTGIQRAIVKKSKAVNQLTENGCVIKQYISATEAARILNIKQGSITNCCRGRHQHAGGYKWEYVT